MRGFAFALLAALAFGCGGSESDAEEATGAGSAGGEEVAREVPVGDPRSYVDEGDTVVMRVDMSRVRTSSLASEISGQLRAYETWQRLLGSSGIDPVRDFDRVLATAPGTLADDSILLVRHHLGAERIRQAVLEMSVSRGTRPAWRQVDGFDVAEWPAEIDPPRLVVITADDELVVTTEPLLDRVIAVAHDHRLRRETDGDPTASYEPALALEERTIATVTASSLTDRTRSRIQHPPDAFDATLADDPAERGRVHITASGRYPTAEEAEAARSYFVGERDFYAGQMLVQAVGLDRPIREAEITRAGETLAVHASFTEEEAQRAFTLLSAFQQFGRN
ncbi:MAG: hypothetical protein AB7S26_10580 [Sandaracinaceae bacterium]